MKVILFKIYKIMKLKNKLNKYTWHLKNNKFFKNSLENMKKI